MFSLTRRLKSLPIAHKNSNETKVCEFVVRQLEAKFGGLRKCLTYPERNKIGSPVDRRFEIGNQYFSVEHKIVESFSQQIGTSINFSKFILPLETALLNQLPKTGTYDLIFHWDMVPRLKPKEIAGVQSDLIAWVIDQSSKFLIDQPIVKARNIKPNGSSQFANFVAKQLKVTLRRNLHWARSDKFDGRLSFSRIAPEPLEDHRTKLILDTLKENCLKLGKKSHVGEYTVLILEDQDMALSNHHLVTEAIQTSDFKIEELPDEIIFADTTIEDNWYFISIYRQGVFLPDAEMLNYFIEVDPSVLIISS
jgi:hypothetical protein